MTKVTPSIPAMIRRELQEYRSSLVITPFAIAATLSGIMLISVLLADRIAFVGQDVIEAAVNTEGSSEVTLTIDLEDENNLIIQEHRIEPPTTPSKPVTDAANSSSGSAVAPPSALQKNGADIIAGGLTPLLIVLNTLMMLVLMVVTANYLLGCLFNDRKDRSILFFKSMPVSDWDQVRAKIAVAVVIAPLLFIIAALLAQCVTLLMCMLLVWRLDIDPFSEVLASVDALPLLMNSLIGWCVTALWIAPVYAWLLLASAAAKRSPFLLAVTPVIALFVLEYAFFGTEHFADAVNAHLPHYRGPADAVGIYVNGSEWQHINLLSLAGGLAFAALAICITVYMRRYRFEL